MKKGDLLFVYGTLRKGERADLSKSQGHFNTCFMGKDEVNGLLYHLGAFPGLKLVSATDEPSDFNKNVPSVTGEVFLIQDPAAVAILDAYEGYHHDNPTKGLYDRAQVFAKSGRLVWAYTYNPDVVDDQLIETGDWKNPRLVLTKRVPNLYKGWH